MQKEVESSKVETRNKYLLLGPCYHLVNNVDGQRKMKTEILAQKMVESEDTAEIVRDIKAEKVEVFIGGRRKNRNVCLGIFA